MLGTRITARVAHCAFSVLFGLAFLLPAFGQENLVSEGKTFNQHVLQRAPLHYPAIAKAAHVEGTVVLEVEVGTDGSVISTKTVSGPPMLIQAAVDSVTKWKFRPFARNGAPIAAKGRLSLIFSLGDGPQPVPPKGFTGVSKSSKAVTIQLRGEEQTGGPDAEIAAKFFPVWNVCMKEVIAHDRDKAVATATTCKQAADIAEKFPADSRFIERRSAFVYAATAIANTGKLSDALTYAEKAVEVVKLGHDDNSGSGAAYSTLGQLQGLMGSFAAADEDLVIAENYERKGILWAKANASSLVPEYENALRRDLRFHALVLQRMNRSVDAQGKLDEADKLRE